MANLFSYFQRSPKPTPAASSPSASGLNVPSWFTGNNHIGAQLFGDSVDEQTSLAIASVYRCVTLISGVVASLDLGVFTSDPVLGQVPVISNLSNMFTVNPYPGRQMTSFIWKELIMMNILLHGNSYSAIRYNGAGKIIGFEHIQPWCVKVMRLGFINKYVVTWPNGDARGVETIDQADMIHIPGPGYDGFVGMSRIRHNARNSLAMARSLEETLGKALDLAVSSKMVVKVAKGTDPDSVKRLQHFLNNEFTGRSNAGRTLLLDEGSDASALSINVVDLALIDSLKYSTQQICMIFGVPPVLLGLDVNSTWGSGIEQILIAFLRFSLNSELERIEAEFTSKVCGKGQYALFNRDQLLSTDAATQAAIASQEIGCGVLTVNEARSKKGRPAVEGGNVPLTNAANVPLTQAIQPRTTPNPPPDGSPAP